MNHFGGDWTRIEILVEHAQAYLTIMHRHKMFNTICFDGLAGSGFQKILQVDKLNGGQSSL